MKLDYVTAGNLMVNCYLLSDSGEAVLIDAPSEEKKIEEMIDKSKCKLTKIILTHGHYDHIASADYLAKKYGAKIYIHKADSEMLSDNDKNLSFLTNEPVEAFSADVFVDEGDELTVGSKTIKVYSTPGHSEGGITLFTEGMVFPGDLLFKNSIGRFDYGNIWVEMNSLRMLMETFGDEERVYPGHGEFTTIGEERRNNPYILNHIN
ncbi:MAG: MBL fold metallo-hydrolase [Clostridia bacterium]|nr:MBL fold metallo-hydrolase [Clostridia bacterium]